MKRGPANNITDERSSKERRTDSSSFESDSDQFSDGPESKVLLPANDQCAPIAIWAKPQTDTIGIEEIGYNTLTTPIEIEYYQQHISKNRNYTKLLELLNELKKAISSDLIKRHKNTDDLLAMHYRAVYLLDNIPQSLENAFLPFAVEYFTVEESDSDNDNFEEPYKFISPDLLRQVDAGDFAAQKMELSPEEEEPAEENIISAPPSREWPLANYQYCYGAQLTGNEIITALPGSVRIFYNCGLRYEFKHASGIQTRPIFTELANYRDFNSADFFSTPEAFDELLKPEEKIAIEQYVTLELNAIEQFVPIALWGQPKRRGIGIESIGNEHLRWVMPIEHEYYVQLVSGNSDYAKLLELLNKYKMVISDALMNIHENTDSLLTMHHRIKYILDNIPKSLENAFLPFSVDYLTAQDCPYDCIPSRFKFPDLLKKVDAGDFADQLMELKPAELAAPVHEGIINVLPSEMLSHILSFLTISNIERAAQACKAFIQAANNLSIWQKKAIECDMPFEKNEPKLKQKLKNYLINISAKFPYPFGISKIAKYPKLRNISNLKITPEMMQGNEIMWGIIPPSEENPGEYPFVSLCLKIRYFDSPCTVTISLGYNSKFEPIWRMEGAAKILPYEENPTRANVLTWDFINRLSRHEPCGLPKYINLRYEGEGSRTLPNDRSVLELTDQLPLLNARRF